MNKLIVLFSIAVLLLPGFIFAQEKVITGTVKDANGPLAGATITEKQQSRNAVAADSRGHFRIVLRGTSGVLVISYLNYQQQEVNVKKEDHIEVIMQQSVQGMEELVVVGFGKKKRITNTGAVSSINASEISRRANFQCTECAGRQTAWFFYPATFGTAR